MKPVCVVGYGMIDGAGANPSECFNNILSDTNFHRDFSSLIEKNWEDITANKAIFPEEKWLSLPVNIKRSNDLPRTTKYGLHAVNQALNHSNLPLKENVAVIFSTLTGGREVMEEQYFNKKMHPRKAINISIDSLAGYISTHYKFKGINTCFHSACATGIVTIDYGISIADQYDYVVVGGADAGINAIDMRFISCTGALSSHSMPFDSKRSGFVMGEGGGCLILQTLEKAKQFNSKIYAYLFPAGHSSDAFHPTGSNGEGALVSMNKALLHFNKVDFVNAHATSTQLGDKIEYDAIRKILPNTPIFSVKGKIGHTYAAAGILETIYSIISLHEGIIPRNSNIESTEMNVNLENIKCNPKAFLKNSFGFGGRCASIVGVLPGALNNA